MNYKETLEKIESSDTAILSRCQKKWNLVAKPLYSLGKLETLTAKIGAALGNSDIPMDKRRVLVFCADNGVVEEGVSQSDHKVTTAVAMALAEGSSNVNIFAQMAHADVEVYDVGMTDDLTIPGLVVDKSQNGTANMVKGPAMSRDDALKAMEVGIHAAEKAKEDGIQIVVIGEMGIGNTTTSAAILSVFSGLEPEEITGRGSGLSDEGLKKKIFAIKKCMEVNRPDKSDPIDVLSKAGGFDIAAMCGVILGGAALHLPIILDGVISGTAALLAFKIDPRTVDYMIPSHISKEPGGKVVLDTLHLSGPICADMALGEGTGGVALLPLLDMALALYKGSHSFDNIGIDAYVEQK